MLKFNLKLVESDTQIKKMIFDALAQDLNDTIRKSLPEINENIKDMVKDSLKQEPEYSSLKSGQLRAEFGIKDPNDVDKVIEAMVDAAKITLVPVKVTQMGVSGGFKYTMLKADDLDGVIFTDIASVIDDKGYYLPWLKWLLYDGGKPLVKKFRVKMGSSNRSRSGMAIMVKSKSNWRVPPQFAGSISSNWVTRSIDKLDQKITNTIQKIIEKNI